MEHYQWFFLTQNLGNNAFTYNFRTPNAKLRVPPLISWSTKDLKIWSQIVFSEFDDHWNLKNYQGLEHFIKIKDSSVPIYIFDNHNHALYFRYLELQNQKKAQKSDFDLIHIDQHSDLNNNQNLLPNWDLDQVFNFVQDQCNVGNFIIPALNEGLINNMTQIRSEYKLLTFENPYKNYILDIDLDFRAEEMSIEKFNDTINKTKKLIPSAKVVTIATSPYFLSQERAIKLLHLILD